MLLDVDHQGAYASTFGHAVDPDKPSIVFVHGAAMDHTVWTLFARYFSRHGYNAIGVDLPGHGRSEGPPLDRIEALSQWLDQALDGLGIEAAVVVGHSFGSLVALELAASTGRAGGLGLVGIGLPMAVSEALLDAARADNHDGFDMVNIWGHSPYAHIGGISNPGMWMTGAQLRLLERAGPGVLFSDLNACNEYGDGLERAAQLTCPTLLVLGERDMMTPVRATRELAKRLTDCEIRIIPRCGHALMSERPNEVLDALAALAARVAEGRAA